MPLRYPRRCQHKWRRRSLNITHAHRRMSSSQGDVLTAHTANQTGMWSGVNGEVLVGPTRYQTGHTVLSPVRLIVVLSVCCHGSPPTGVPQGSHLDPSTSFKIHFHLFCFRIVCDCRRDWPDFSLVSVSFRNIHSSVQAEMSPL